MKFGKLSNISGVDFTLPDDHPLTATSFSGVPTEKLSVYLGGTMWNIRPWRGKWYDVKTPIKNFGQAYCKLFNTIELNATHYKIHGPEMIQKWKSWAEGDFTFCPKFPNLITHYRQFNNCEGLTDEFFEAVLEFKEMLGPCFIQLPERTSPKQAPKIQKYLQTLPEDVDIHVEFRHEDWFKDIPEATDTWMLMREKGLGSVITDTAGRRDAMHMHLTTPKLILRYGGIELQGPEEQRMKDWAARIHQWADQGLEWVQIWMHQPDSVITPETNVEFLSILRKEMGDRVVSKDIVPTQSSAQTLF